VVPVASRVVPCCQERIHTAAGAGMDHDDQITIASLNMHGGLDRRGQPFDVEAACHYLKADVITVQEAWLQNGQPDPLAAPASALGAQVKRASLAVDTTLVSLGVGPGTEPGTWGLAVLTVLPVTGYHVVGLGRAPGDPHHRAAQVVTVAVPGGKPLCVVNTHLTHRYSSPVQLRRLLRHLAGGTDPTVIVGDLNMPRAATWAVVGYSRVVRGRTYPAHRPLVQLDHVLAGRRVTGLDGEVLDPVGSDHLPIRAQLTVG
jgi:endonuclease/exonuclease/phosphatase family metal-dependent hydrolase